MIRSSQPIVASISFKKLQLTIGYWLLSAHIDRVGVSCMQDFYYKEQGGLGSGQLLTILLFFTLDQANYLPFWEFLTGVRPSTNYFVIFYRGTANY